MEQQTIHKRLYWAALILAIYVLFLLSAQLLTAKSASERASYTAAVATLPGRFHEPMSFYELEYMVELLQALQLGGDVSALGVKHLAPPLAEVLGEDRFDMDATLALLEDKRVRPALAKVELLAAKVERANERRGRIWSYLPWGSIAGIFAILLFLGQAWRRSRSKLTDNISIIDEPGEAPAPETFEEYLQKVIDEEFAFTGFKGKLNCTGFDKVTLPQELMAAVETAAEQLVRNSVEHGGRASEDRLMADKPEFLGIDVSLSENDSHYELVVRDDGEGIDETEVVLRAIKLGLLSAEDARRIPRGQGLKYIFMPGYSGEKQAFGVSENSIGLDEVRRIVKQNGGTTGLLNLPGSHCQFTMRFAKEPINPDTPPVS